MTEELKPCPFCGEAKMNAVFAQGSIRVYAAYVECGSCGARSKTHLGEDAKTRAAEAWNRRAERTCRMVRARWDDGECVWGCRCTACGDRFTYETGTTWRYCPACGAKVVDE